MLTTFDKTIEVSKIVQKYKHSLDMDYRSMAEQLNDAIGVPEAITYGSIFFWATGKYYPAGKMSLLRHILTRLPPEDWRYKMAAEIVAVEDDGK